MSEKLVPYVEGVLAEQDARDVAEYLSAHPEALEDVRFLKEAITALRAAVGQGVSPRVPGEMSSEDLVQLVTDPEGIEPVKRKALRALLAESPQYAREAELLEQLDRDLEHQFDSLSPPDAVPPPLRREFQRLYGQASPSTSGRRPGWLESLHTLLGGLNPRPFVALATVLVLLCVGGFLVESSRIGRGNIAVTESAAPPPTEEPGTEASGTPDAFGGLEGMALASDATDPGELRRQSQVLLDNKVQYAVKDGRLFVAQEDVQRARRALTGGERDPRELAQARTRELKSQEPDTAVTADNEADQAAAASGEVASEPVVRPAGARPRSSDVTAPPLPQPATPAALKDKQDEGAAGRTVLAAKTEAPGEGGAVSPRPLDEARRDVRPEPASSEQKLTSKGAGPSGLEDAAPRPVADSPDEVVATAEEKESEAAPAQRAERQDEVLTEAAPPSPPLSAAAKTGIVANVPVGQAAPPPPSPVKRAAAGSATRAASLPAAGAEIPVARSQPAPAPTPSASRSESQLARWAQQVAADFAEGSVVTTEMREDGSLALYVRAGRELSDQDVESLRRLLRDRLDLRDTDTIIIRQP